MAAIHSKDTKPEMIVRKGLWRKGFRYRLNDKRLPGHPDLVLRKYRTCIFINGCFWHGHGVTESPIKSEELRNKNGDLVSSACCKIPKTNREFWVNKIRRNQQRDKEEQRKLAEMGWHCITVWECELTEQRVQSDTCINSAESRGKKTESQLKLTKREQTLDSIAFTLNHIYLQDRQIPKLYVQEEHEYLLAAEEEKEVNS